MLKSLHLENLTVFGDAKLDFGSNLNVVIGENGTGKTHILKAAYSTMAVSARAAKDPMAASGSKAYLQRALAEKLVRVFKPNELGRLARRVQGNARCKISCGFDDVDCDVSLSFHTRSKSEVVIEQMPSKWVELSPAYFPTRELLSIYPGFVSLYETTELEFEETWRDTCILLGAGLARGARESRIKELLAPLEEAMGGTIVLDSSGRFYLSSRAGIVEMHLVAEGRRKLAMLARLIATGALLEKNCLFWDEPEANLNPRIVRVVARTIFELAKLGIQIFIATHSLFLMREIYLLQATSGSPVDLQCFGLHAGQSGVDIEQGPTIDDVGDISSLDEELDQSQRYLESEAAA